MTEKSTAIVAFLASLLPLYDREQYEGADGARSLQDGTVILPVDESDWDEERGTVRAHWQGDPRRESIVEGEMLAAIALERYVRLHGIGAPEEAIAAELWFMARHFHFKTGCTAYLPQLAEPPSAWMRAGKTAMEFGRGILVNLLSKPFGA
ncbi:hypothetical protein [Lysobacter sp. HA18]